MKYDISDLGLSEPDLLDLISYLLQSFCLKAEEMKHCFSLNVPLFCYY